MAGDGKDASAGRPGRLSFVDRYLTLWIFLATVPEEYLLGNKAMYLFAYNNVKTAYSKDGYFSDAGAKTTLKALASFNPNNGPVVLRQSLSLVIRGGLPGDTTKPTASYDLRGGTLAAASGMNGIRALRATRGPRRHSAGRKGF